MGYCKQKAVEAGHSWALFQYVIVTLPVMANLISRLKTATGLPLEITNYWAMALLDTLYFLPALFLSYWLFWVLIRVPVVNALFSGE